MHFLLTNAYFFFLPTPCSLIAIRIPSLKDKEKPTSHVFAVPEFDAPQLHEHTISQSRSPTGGKINSPFSTGILRYAP